LKKILHRPLLGLALPAVIWLAAAPPSFGATDAETISVDFTKTLLISKSTATLQVVVNPLLASGSPIHDRVFAALKDLDADDVRFVPWNPYPRLAIAELDPPAHGKTSWDFSRIDPLTEDFLAATKGHPIVMNFSTIPAWMIRSDQPITYPADPSEACWSYGDGSSLADPSGRQVADYFARLVGWYTQGGFTDECGAFHASAHHEKFPIWEVLNEPNQEHHFTPESYTVLYDTIVEAIHKVSPETQFMGLALSDATRNPKWYEYFLNPANHRPGVPLDYISYHFYATPEAGETVDQWQYTFFDEADGFLAGIRFIQNIRDRLSPRTKTDTDELGAILPTDITEIYSGKTLPDDFPPLYWNAAGALYAYLYIEEAKLGVDIIGESQLVGYPGQFPSVTMINWSTGQPNARYWVLKLIKDNFHPGDRIIDTAISPGGQINAQAFVTPAGKKLLIVNKRNATANVTLPREAASVSIVDQSTGHGPAQTTRQSGTTLHLAPFAVAVVSWN
jgi:hypothetical protein